MRKLVYLIVVIVALGLIVVGCIPTVTPTGQDELGTLPNKGIGDPGEVWNQTTNIQYSAIQAAITAASPGDTISVGAGTYNERLTISKPLDLRGAQYGVDPTQPGARTAPDNESVITLTGLQNPNILIKIPVGVSNVSIAGFTLIGSPIWHYADEVVVRCYADNITIEDNVINGYVGVLYQGSGQDLTVHSNHFVVNKDGVVCQSGGSDVMISDNIFTMGSSPVVLPIESQAIYMTGLNLSSVTGNTATNFNLRGLSGSHLNNLIISGNTFDENRDAISIWGNSTFITISSNVLSNSQRHGINIKGQDFTIADNDIINNGDCGIAIDRHVIDTERVTISYNNISDNTNYGVRVNVANVPKTVDATDNWWGSKRGPSRAMGEAVGHDDVKGDRVSPNVKFAPWAKECF